MVNHKSTSLLQLPNHILENDETRNEVEGLLADALATAYGVSDWRKFAKKFSLDTEDESSRIRQIINDSYFENESYGARVIDFVEDLFQSNPTAVSFLFEDKNVQRDLSEDAIKLWKGEDDPIEIAFSHGLEELETLAPDFDLIDYSNRVNRALPEDPSLAIGATKDLLEAAMKSILHEKGVSDFNDRSFDGLMSRCFIELGLQGQTQPKSSNEANVHKIASLVKKILSQANMLRNSMGTGHGRVFDRKIDLDAADASFVASLGMILAAWLLRQSRQ